MLFDRVPIALLLLLLGLVQHEPRTRAQVFTTPVELDKITAHSISTNTQSLLLSLPSTPRPVVLSVELCTQVDGQNPPRFFALANTASSTTRQTSSQTSTTTASTPSITPVANSQELDVSGGVGYWNSVKSLDNGGILQVILPPGATGGPWRFSVGLSTNEPLHWRSERTPLFGDSTSTSALLFSPPIPNTASDFVEPTFPKYELPDKNLSSPSAPTEATSTNNTLVVFPTSLLINDDGQFKTELTSSACYLQSLEASTNTTGSLNIATRLVLRNQEEGWRTQHIVQGLNPSTNYTFYVMSTFGNQVLLSQPAFFKTKRDGFPCTLAHSLPFCPSVAYSVPFPPLTGTPSTYDASNFPSQLQETLFNSLGNFTSSLKTFACGRDLYSIVQSCASCERAYRTWLCSTLVPRCGEVDESLLPPAAIVPRVVGSTNTTATSARVDQTVLGSSAVGSYSELLPCLETCHAVDRACPPTLNWRCPRKGITAERSYGVGFIDKEGDDVSGGGQEGAGRTGRSQDPYGNVWCNRMTTNDRITMNKT
ncbi:SubName: Full=Uncharacterized protein {ECO:0000313/EMBL:CCA68259.1} [Serendipita indica DSM 11827]|uniref:Stretch-activated cation channel Mid1 n=1 Tax=Serendipita indica (strain DSM 11827) TaxID=1109443 RepID=G4TAB6_SERID|nr:SubName: Full=Uncharacterized protein {ECO:0000313/EMBL:CCA68259.1} [Serendipita indica DSM 11827]CCA68259.1 hypothetical protein PIIN_02124 [Serendipita indica DSM 11827]